MCALAFLLTGFCHGVQHFAAAAPVIASHMPSDGSDNSPDAPDQIEAGICHGCCVMVAIPVAEEATPLGRITAAYPAARLVNLRPHSPIAETPPPIVEI